MILFKLYLLISHFLYKKFTCIDLSLPLNRDERIGARSLQLYRKRHEKKCKCLTQKRRSRGEVKKKPDWLEREKEYFFNEWVKSYQFLPTFREEVCFYYLVYLRLYFFCNWDFGTIAWIAVLSGTECRPFTMSKTHLVDHNNFVINFFWIYSAAETCIIMCFSSWAFFLSHSEKHIDKSQLCCYALRLIIKIVI